MMELVCPLILESRNPGSHRGKLTVLIPGVLHIFVLYNTNNVNISPAVLSLRIYFSGING